MVQEEPDVLQVGVASEDVCAGGIEGSGSSNQFRVVYLMFRASVNGDVSA
jgi:hypothetical protein